MPVVYCRPTTVEVPSPVMAQLKDSADGMMGWADGLMADGLMADGPTCRPPPTQTHEAEQVHTTWQN